MDVFGSTVPGTARRISMPSASSASIDFAVGDLFSGNSLLVTSVGYSGRAALQLMRTLGHSVYVYNFGLRDTMVVVRGMAFLNVCGGQDGGSALMRLVARFESAAAAGTAVQVRIGMLGFGGFVDTLRSTWSDQSTGAMGFELRAHAISAEAGALMAGTP